MPRIDHKPANATDGVADTETTIVGGTVTVVDSGGSLSIDDNAGSITVDDGGTTLSIDDGAGSITVDGTTDVGNTTELAEDIATAIDLPTAVETENVTTILASDWHTQELLGEILKQLKIMNIHLSYLTGNALNKNDIMD